MCGHTPQGVRCVVTPHRVSDVWSHLTRCQVCGHTLQGARCVVTPYFWFLSKIIFLYLYLDVCLVHLSISRCLSSAPGTNQFSPKNTTCNNPYHMYLQIIQEIIDKFSVPKCALYASTLIKKYFKSEQICTNLHKTKCNSVSLKFF